MSIQAMAVKHPTKGLGIVVDRLSHYDEEQKGFIVKLGVTYEEHPDPAVHYEDTEDLECVAVLDYEEIEDDADEVENE